MKSKIISDKDLQCLESALRERTFPAGAAVEGLLVRAFISHCVKAARFLMERNKFPEYEIQRVLRRRINILERDVLFAGMIKSYKQYLEDPSRNVKDPLILSLTVSELVTLIQDTVMGTIMELEKRPGTKFALKKTKAVTRALKRKKEERIIKFLEKNDTI